MKKQLIQLTQPLFSRLGLCLRRKKDDQLLRDRIALLSEIVNHTREEPSGDKHSGITFIIFSKDRVLQLDGLLQSLLHHVSGNYSIHVIYATSSDAHGSAYKEVANKITHQKNIQWREEDDFRSDLIETLETVETESVCFLVDDIVFIRPINLDAIAPQTRRNGIVSLRLGRNITFCYTKQKTMQRPALSPTQCQSGLLEFSWEEGNYDWAYPLSVDGHIFPTEEIYIAAKQLQYKAPNTFERALQILTPLYAKRPGYCFEAPILVNIPLNRVQNEIDNISANISPEFLLEKWNEGMTLDFMQFSDIQTQSVHEERGICFSELKSHS